MPATIPTDLVGLFISVVLGLLGLLTWVVRRTLITTAAQQSRIVDVLDNHLRKDHEDLGRISEHMAKTNTALDLVVTRLLDAALRGPVGEPEDSPRVP